MMVNIHHNFFTSYISWRSALERVIELEPDPENKAYWEEQLRAFDLAYDMSPDIKNGNILMLA